MTVSPGADSPLRDPRRCRSDRGNEIEISNGSASRPVQETLAASEVIVLETGERTAVSDEPSIWAEWAPDGSALAVQPVSQGARWLIADERRLPRTRHDAGNPDLSSQLPLLLLAVR